MSYTLTIDKEATKFIKKQDKVNQRRLRNAILAIQENPFQHGAEKMTGIDAYKKRVGSFRIIYEIYNDILLIHVVRVGNRGDVYKDL